MYIFKLSRERENNKNFEYVHIYHLRVERNDFQISTFQYEKSRRHAEKKGSFSFSFVFDVSQNVIQAIVFCSHCMTYPAAISPRL